MIQTIKTYVIDFIVSKLSKKAAQNSVNDIMADFTVKVQALHNLVDAKHTVMAENAKAIATLRAESKAADAEAAKATRVARTIASLIE